MTDVIDWHVVMLAPEERHGVEPLIQSQHVACHSLTLALGNHPVLDANIVAGMRIGPARNIACGIDAGSARFEIGIHLYAAVHYEARLLGERQTRPHANAEHHKIGFDRLTAFQRNTALVDRRHGVLKMESHAMLLMQRAHDVAHLWPKDAFHRPLLWRDHMDVDVACAKGGSRLQSDETRPDN